MTLQRRLLYGAASGCVFVGAVAVAWSLGDVPGPEPASPANALRPQPGQTIAATDTASPATARTQVDLSLPLQQTLYDPPPPPPKPKPTPKPAVVRKPKPSPPPALRLDWTLLGTIIESKRRVAILVDASGKTDIRAIGEKVELAPGGVLVRNIDSETVTLEHRGSRSTLRLKRDFNGGNGQQPRAGRRRNR